MRISVVTATYNRKHTLNKLFESLNKNYLDFGDFEWIVMDDGSTDGTKEQVLDWSKKSKYKIDYHYNKNMGKQKEINDSIKYVTGDIFIEIDSDDYLTDHALKKISEDYENLKDNNVYGIIYKRILNNQNMEVDKSIDNKTLTLFDIHNKYGYDFDMNLTFKTSVRKKYIYEIEDKEKFITENRLYYLLDQVYEGMVFKDYNLVVGEYKDEGYSKNINKIFKTNPKGYYHYFNECLTYIKKDTTLKRKIYFLKHYILFSYLNNLNIFECIIKAKKYKFFIALLVIPGYIKSRKF